MVPKKSECTGCDSMAGKIAGYRVYRAIVMKEKKRKIAMSRIRKAAPIARKTACVDCHGSRKSRVLHMPGYRVLAYFERQSLCWLAGAHGH